MLAPPTSFSDLDRVSPKIYSLGAYVRQLGTEERTTIEVQPGLAKVRIAVERKAASADSLLQAIAFASHAHLIRSSASKWTFGRTASDRKEVRKLDRAMVQARLEKQLRVWDDAAQSSDLNLAHKVGQEFQGYLNYQHQQSDAVRAGRDPRTLGPRPFFMPLLPAGRLLRKLLDRIGLSKLTDLDPEETAFYSNTPDGDELPAGSDDDLLADYVKERETFRQQATQFIDIAQWNGIRGLPTFSWNRSTPEPDSLKFVLQVHRKAIYMTVELNVFDESGKKLDSCFFTSIPDGRPANNYVEGLDAAQRNQVAWLDLMEPTRSYAAGFSLIQSTRSEAKQMTKVPSLKDLQNTPEMLTSPDKHEPDQFVLPDALTVFEDSSQPSPAVWVVPDECWYQAISSVRNGRLPLTVFPNLTMGENPYGPQMEYLPRDGIFIGRPADPLLAEHFQVDRKVLGEGIRETLREDQLSIRNWAKFQNRLGSAATADLATAYLQPIRNIVPWLVGADKDYFYRFIGGVSDDEWDALVAGKRVKVMDQELVSLLRLSVINNDWRTAASSPLSDEQLQPQELFKQVEASDAGLGLRRDYQTVAVFWSGEESDRPGAGPSTPGAIAKDLVLMVKMQQRSIASMKGPQLSDQAVLDHLLATLPLKFKTCPRLYSTFYIEVPNGVRLEKTLYVDGDINPHVDTFDTIPADLRNEILSVSHKLLLDGG